jgi:hypothetical protein
MVPRFRSILCGGAFIGAAVGLSACNVSSNNPAPAQMAAAPSSAPAKPDWPQLPPGAACTGDLDRFQSVLSADVGTGNLNKSVYDTIQGELVKAAAACAAGRDAEAQRLVRASKERHGYRV